MLSTKSFLPPNLSIIAERAAEKDLQNTISNPPAGGGNRHQQRRGGEEQHGNKDMQSRNTCSTDGMEGAATRNKRSEPTTQQQRRIKSLYHHRAVLVSPSPSSNLLSSSGDVRKHLSAEAADTRPLLSPAPVGVASDLAGVPNTLAYYDIESDRGIVHDKDREADIERKLLMMREQRQGGTASPQPTSAYDDDEERTTTTNLLRMMGNNNNSKNTSGAAASPSSQLTTSASSSQAALTKSNSNNNRGEAIPSHAQQQNSRSMSSKTIPQQITQHQQQQEHNHKSDLASAVRLRSAYNYAKKCCGVDDHWVVTTYQQHVFLNGSRPVLASSLRHWLLSEPPPRDGVVESLVHSFIEDHFHLAKAFVMLFEGAAAEEEGREEDEDAIANKKSSNRTNSIIDVVVAGEVDDALALSKGNYGARNDGNNNANNTIRNKKNASSTTNNTNHHNNESDVAIEFSSCKRFCQVNKLSLADVASWLDGDDLYCRDKAVVRTIFEGVIRALALRQKRQQQQGTSVDTNLIGSSGVPPLNSCGFNVSAAARTSGHLHNTCQYHQPQANTTTSSSSSVAHTTTTTPLLASYARGEGPNRPIEEFRKRLAWFKSDRGILEHVVELRKVMPSVGRGGSTMMDDGGDGEGGYNNNEPERDFPPSSQAQGARGDSGASAPSSLPRSSQLSSKERYLAEERSSSSSLHATNDDNGNALVEGAIRFDRSSGDMGSMGGGGQGGVYKSRRPLTNSPSCIMPYPAIGSSTTFSSPSGASGSSTVSLTKGARARTFLSRFRTSESYTAAVRASDPDNVYYEKRMQFPPKSWTPDYVEMSRRTWSGKGGSRGANAGSSSTVQVSRPLSSNANANANSNVVRPYSQNDVEVSTLNGNLTPQQKREIIGVGQGGKSLPPLPELRSNSPLLTTKKTVSASDAVSLTDVTSPSTNTRAGTHPFLKDGARAGEQRAQGGPLGGWRSRVDGAAEEIIAARRMKVLREEFKVKSEAELRHLGGGGR